MWIQTIEGRVVQCRERELHEDLQRLHIKTLKRAPGNFLLTCHCMLSSVYIAITVNEYFESPKYPIALATHSGP